MPPGPVALLRDVRRGERIDLRDDLEGCGGNIEGLHKDQLASHKKPWFAREGRVADAEVAFAQELVQNLILRCFGGQLVALGGVMLCL